MTNFEKVTSSMEKLLNFIDQFIPAECFDNEEHCADVDGDCMRCIRKWLEKEVEDDASNK